jgi:hypothetical protein
MSDHPGLFSARIPLDGFNQNTPNLSYFFLVVFHPPLHPSVINSHLPLLYSELSPNSLPYYSGPYTYYNGPKQSLPYLTFSSTVAANTINLFLVGG